MKCYKAKEQLALYVGGDLPSELRAALLAHLDSCQDCTKELAALKSSGAFVQELADNDTPPPLPTDFADQILNRVQAEEAQGQSSEQSSPSIVSPQWRSILVPLATAAAVVLLLFGGWRILINPGGTSDNSEPILVVSAEGEAVSWETLQEGVAMKMEGPVLLDEWIPSSESGVIAILHKNDNMLGPDTFTMDYCGEVRNFARLRSYPWIKQREKKLLACAGSPEQLYVAVCSMPGSSRVDRKKLTESLVGAYNPCLNQKKGA